MMFQHGAFHSIGAQPASALPTWLAASGNVVAKWVPIANTSLYTHYHTSSDYTALMSDTGVGGTSAFAYSGSAFRQASAEFLLGAYGGGANAWPGTDIVGLSLTADTPAWVTHVAPRQYSEMYPTVPSVGHKALTVNVGNSTVTCSTVNGFANGEDVIFGGTPPSPLVAGTTYYVVNASGYQPVTFQAAATQGGAAITLTDSGSSPTATWTAGSHDITKSGYPNAGHSYYQHHYVPQTGELVLNGRSNSWEVDYGIYGTVRTWTYGEADWDAADIYPDVSMDYDNAWQCVDSATGTIYYCKIAGNWYARNPTTGAETYKGNAGNGAGAGVAIFDPIRGTIIKWDTTLHWQELTPSTGASRNFTLGGPDVAAFYGSYSNGLCVDEVTGTYYLYMDTGVLYALAWNGSNLDMTAVTATGTTPTAGWGGVNGGIGIWSRLYYSTELHGVALLANTQNNVFFMRTN